MDEKKNILKEVGFGVSYAPAAALDLVQGTVGVVAGLPIALLKGAGDVVAAPAKALYGAGKLTENPVGKSLFYVGSAVLSLPAATLFLLRETIRLTATKVVGKALDLAAVPFKSIAWGIKGKNYVKERQKMFKEMKEARELEGEKFLTFRFIKEYIERKRAEEVISEFFPNKDEAAQGLIEFVNEKIKSGNIEDLPDCICKDLDDVSNYMAEMIEYFIEKTNFAENNEIITQEKFLEAFDSCLRDFIKSHKSYDFLLKCESDFKIGICLKALREKSQKIKEEQQKLLDKSHEIGVRVMELTEESDKLQEESDKHHEELVKLTEEVDRIEEIGFSTLLIEGNSRLREKCLGMLESCLRREEETSRIEEETFRLKDECETLKRKGEDLLKESRQLETYESMAEQCFEWINALKDNEDSENDDAGDMEPR